LEIGAPMACLYLLGFPDYYTSHIFRPFFWNQFVYEAQKLWNTYSGPDACHQTEQIGLQRKSEGLVGISPVFDYIYRPMEFEGMCLYNWI
ncbi:hypothetical protein PAXINDRAFT_51839, partial [Paxillus involutus ATCC 200175]